MNLWHSYERAITSARTVQLGASPTQDLPAGMRHIATLPILPGTHFAWIKNDKHVLLGAVAEKTFHEPVLRDDLPADEGVVVFENPIAEVEGKSFDGFAWAPPARVGVATDMDSVVVFMLTWGPRGLLSPSGENGFVLFGYSTEAVLVGRLSVGKRNWETRVWLETMASAYWRLVGQRRYVEARREPPPERVRRHVQRAALDAPDILVVRLVRHIYPQSDGDEAARHLTCCFWVDPYKKQDGTKVRGHLKGPLDMPYRPKNRVHALVQR